MFPHPPTEGSSVSLQREGKRIGYPQRAAFSASLKSAQGKKCGYDAAAAAAEGSSTGLIPPCAAADGAMARGPTEGARRGDRTPLRAAVRRAADVSAKPNSVASAVGRGSYECSLQAPTGLHRIYVNRTIKSGLDHPDTVVPLYSSFTYDRQFLDPVRRRLKESRLARTRKRPPHADGGVGDALLQAVATMLEQNARGPRGRPQPHTARPVRPASSASLLHTCDEVETVMAAASTDLCRSSAAAASRPSSSARDAASTAHSFSRPGTADIMVASVFPAGSVDGSVGWVPAAAAVPVPAPPPPRRPDVPPRPATASSVALPRPPGEGWSQSSTVREPTPGYTSSSVSSVDYRRSCTPTLLAR